ncbi:uncharacterized protein LOC130991882 isoform X2 [Salvia miltiorrhiza]|uniref:uncharacterized protein LOC130991882 isoform X2 n=1 Tax=Salvia miltiorrhiza TaxID=226208 RepID=UPI0025AD16D1|nr:uncharacterized protein LOC130991882 isoform X2 [Salvia miltiorrhiza]
MFHAPFLSAQFVHLIGALEKVSALFRFPSSQSVMSESGGEESGKQGKRKAKADDSGGEELQLAAEDPLLVFGSEIMTIILSKLDVRSLAEARLVSRGWQAVASSDRIWAPKCQELWLDKAHIPRVSMAEGLPKIVATLLSIRDGKRLAPEYWRDLDPSWRSGGGAPMRRYFHPDGSITADPEDKVWGGHESSYTIVTGVLADGKVREHYVRINRWPKMMVERNPDWSWELRNHLYCYRSIPDADGRRGSASSGSISISISGGFSSN